MYTIVASGCNYDITRTSWKLAERGHIPKKHSTRVQIVPTEDVVMSLPL